MPAEALAGIAEGLVPLFTALMELLFLVLQLIAALAELVFTLLFYAIAGLWTACFSKKKPHQPPVSISKKLNALWNKRFGAIGTKKSSGKKLNYWNPYSSAESLPFQWKKWHTIAASILFSIIAVIVVSLWLLWGKRFDVIITQQQVQEAVQARFPKSKSLLNAFKLSLENPMVKLDEKANRIHASLELKLDIANLHDIVGKAEVTASLIYNENKGAFYLHDIIIDKVTLPAIPERWSARASKFVTDSLLEHLDSFPVYQLKQENFKQKFTKLILRKVRVEGGNLILTMGIG